MVKRFVVSEISLLWLVVSKNVYTYDKGQNLQSAYDNRLQQPAIPANLPIKTIDWKSLLPLVGKANRSLAEYNGMLRHMPNAPMLLAPLTIQEAVLSSRIEGTLATMSEVLQFEAGGSPVHEARRQDIEEILNYRAALELAKQELEGRPFSLNLLLKLHAILLRGVRGQNKARGEFRRQQNYIGSIHGSQETIRFTPPEWNLLPDALSNWEKYYHSDESDLIVQLAVIHAQFEFLHPFLDGNGRLGRILVPIFLYERNLLLQPNFYLSEYIEAHRDEYILLLNGLGRSKMAWTSWVRFFLTAVDQQAQQNARKATALLNLYEDLKTRFLEVTHSQYAVPLLDFIFSTPVFEANQVRWSIAPPSRPTLTSMLSVLSREGVLTIIREGAGRRPYIWALMPLIELTERRVPLDERE